MSHAFGMHISKLSRCWASFDQSVLQSLQIAAHKLQPWPICLDANEFEFLLSAIATFLRTLRKRKDAPDDVLGETLDDVYRKSGVLLGPRADD